MCLYYQKLSISILSWSQFCKVNLPKHSLSFTHTHVHPWFGLTFLSPIFIFLHTRPLRTTSFPTLYMTYCPLKSALIFFTPQSMQLCTYLVSSPPNIWGEMILPSLSHTQPNSTTFLSCQYSTHPPWYNWVFLETWGYARPGGP